MKKSYGLLKEEVTTMENLAAYLSRNGEFGSSEYLTGIVNRLETILEVMEVEA